MIISNEIKIAEGELKKLEANTKKSSSRNVKTQIPVIGNLADEIENNVSENLVKKQKTAVDNNGPYEKTKPTGSTYISNTRGHKPQHSVRNIPVPSFKQASWQQVSPNLSPDHKCFVCIPDGSDRCKYCKFREDELSEERLDGYSR